VLAQTNPNWQLVVVNDGSEDNTSKIADEYAAQDARISVTSQDNSGAAKARNVGVFALDTYWATYLDADDELDSAFVEAMVELVKENPGYDYYSSNAVMVNPDGSHRQFRKQARPREILLSEMLRKCVITGAGTLQRVEVFKQNGGFNERIHHAEDYCYWLRTMAEGRTVLAAERVLYYYHVLSDGSNKSNHLYGKLNALQQIEKIESEKTLSAKEQAAVHEGKNRLVTAVSRSYLNSGDKQGMRELASERLTQDNFSKHTQKQLEQIFNPQSRFTLRTIAYIPYTFAKNVLAIIRGLKR